MIQGLDFHMPAFQSLAWVSDNAGAFWQARFERLNHALIDQAALAVAERDVATRHLRVPGRLALSLPDLARRHGVEIEIGLVGDLEGNGPLFHDVCLWKEGPRPERRRSKCFGCARLEDGCNEMPWVLLHARASELAEDACLELPSGQAFPAFFNRLLVDPVNQASSCVSCLTVLSELAQVVRDLQASGHQECAAWLQELSHWPVEWSAAHGIAELRTPVFKLAYNTWATSQAYWIQVKGEAVPEFAARGLVFPYLSTDRRKVTQSRGFKVGLAHGKSIA